MTSYLSLIGKQAGKVTFTSVWKGADILGSLKNGVVIVNPLAQRTLAKGADATPTHQLLDEERVHTTPRMKDFVNFLHRVMKNLEDGNVTEGFLGAVLMVIPEGFTDARWVPLEVNDREARDRVGLLTVDDVGVGRPAFHLGDGQGRFFVLYSLEYAAKKEIEAKRKEIDKALKAKKSVGHLEAQLADLKGALERVQKFIRGLMLTVVCYARAVQDDNTLVGLDERAERRLYIEGNNLNSRASKEEALKFDSVSPIGLGLSELRVEPELFWLDDGYVEGNSKSIAKSSSKLFTLSAISQAYGLSVANTTKTQSLDPGVFTSVGTHKAFAEAYWRKVTDVFEPLWRRPAEYDSGEWLDYLGRRRAEQNVSFQGVFLQALGRLGYALGTVAEWEPESPQLENLENLRPRTDSRPDGVDYRAFRGRVAQVGDDDRKKEWTQLPIDADEEFAEEWTEAMMKARAGGTAGFAFNNTRDSVAKTYEALRKMAEVPEVEVTPEETEEAEGLVEVEDGF